jgi:4-cresol dehydrogenase (hydroxylating) flavoprotein subunit
VTPSDPLPNGPSWPRALEEWTQAIGREYVVCDPAELQAASTATFLTRSRVPAILKPASRQQVQECVAIAAKHRIPLYPFSTGKNWGYGSRVPPRDSVLLDLSRLNRILDFNERLAYVTLEPGVTQRQLHDYLTSQGSRLWLDATGATPEASLIGNIADRGFGHTPYGDHFAHTCALEVVLATGECIRTGFGRFPGAKAAPVYRWGMGPVLDGLFSQSNFGVITSATIWLMPKPECFQAFFFRVESDEDIEPLIEALRPLRMDGTLRSAIHIGNDYKVLAGMQTYPWRESAGRTPLPDEVMIRMRKQLQFGAWNGGGGLYGSKDQVSAARRRLKRTLRGKVSRLTFLDDRRLSLASRFAPLFSLIAGWDLSRALELVAPVFNLMRGIPTSAAVASAYWRKHSIPSGELDPDRDRCGLLWCSPVAPLSGPEVRELTSLVRATVIRHGFEPQMSLTLITERAVACIVTIGYDRELEGEDERAEACNRDLLDRAARAGYYTYRLNLLSMELFEPDHDYKILHQRLKNTLDPHHIIAPGRYLIES